MHVHLCVNPENTQKSGLVRYKFRGWGTSEFGQNDTRATWATNLLNIYRHLQLFYGGHRAKVPSVVGQCVSLTTKFQHTTLKCLWPAYNIDNGCEFSHTETWIEWNNMNLFRQSMEIHTVLIVLPRHGAFLNQRIQHVRIYFHVQTKGWPKLIALGRETPLRQESSKDFSGQPNPRSSWTWSPINIKVEEISFEMRPAPERETRDN